MIRRTSTLLAVAALAACPLLAQGTQSTDKKEAAKPAPAKSDAKPTMSPEEAAMLQEWAKYAMPGKNHEYLKPLAGSWKVAGKFWLSPDAPPTESAGKSEMKLILGGRFLEQDYTSEFQGQPFLGHGLTGYDNYTQKYTGTWCDTMGTMIAKSEGTVDAAGKVFTFTGTFEDPLTKKPHPFRQVLKIESDSRFTFEGYDPDKTGKEYKSMELVYTK